MQTDPYEWLEEVEGAKSLEWVRAQNAKAEAIITTNQEFTQLRDSFRAILDSAEKIPPIDKIGKYYYNFWKDKDHERGIWRRTTLDEYRKTKPDWETVLDLDELNRVENKKYVWHGHKTLQLRGVEPTRCIISLSPGGSDADESREFDLESKSWVKGGFVRAESKGGLSWKDMDTVYVYTDFGLGTMTSSGYPRIVKEWKRGTPMSSATTVYEGQYTDMYIAANRDLESGLDFVQRTLAFYNDELYLYKGVSKELIKLDLPNSSTKDVHKNWLTVELRTGQ